MVKVDTLVIGGGFAGLSTAYHLASSGLKNITVIEQEEKLGGHSSGRNAGMIRQTVSDPVLAYLAREGRNSLERLEKRSWGDIEFASIGALLLAKDKGVNELRNIEKTVKKEKVPVRWFSKKEAENLVPALKSGDFEKALFCPTDAVLKIEVLLGGFLKMLKRRRVPVLCGRRVLGIQKKTGGFLVRTSRENFFAKRIVNAAGACAGIIAQKAGAARVPFKAYRRHIFMGRSPLLRGKSPFVWDISHEFYFRPAGKSWLLSPGDKTAVSKRYSAAGKEKMDPRMKGILIKKLNNFSGNFKSLRIKSAKSGLRTMTPDGRFVVGEDPKLKGFFWVAGLGGHGVTTCFSVGRLASDLVLGKKRENYLVKALSPARFLNAA